jgi:NodT family efflux transporter outer membrane factor (OMF) lipoprotein
LSTSIRILASTAMAAVLAAGCAAVGPNFEAPAAPTIDHYAMSGDAAPALAAAQAPAGAWWTALGSPQLNAVMAQALKDSPTLAEADATLRRAQLQVTQANALIAPQVEGAASAARQRINTQQFGFTGFPSPTINLYSVGASVSYDLDLFGGAKRGLEAARARAQEQSNRTDAAYLTLTGNVAMQAIRIAALRAQLDAARAVIADGEQTLEIARKAEAAGATARSSLSPSVAQVAADRAQIAPVEAQLSQARHALALLVGQAPAAWTAPDFDLAGFAAPSAPATVPSELVRRRPDILAAESALHAATAQVGVETAKLYPNLKLSAGYAQGALTPGDLFSYDAAGWNFGPSLSLPIFDGGRRKAGRDAARQEALAADARYRQTVLVAFSQVADALDAIAHDDQEMRAVQDQNDAAQRSFNDQRRAFDLGGGTLLSVVDAQRQLARSRRDLARVQGNRYADLVRLFTAVAADWRPAP